MAFDFTKPDPTTQNMTAYSQSIRDNQVALRNMITAGTLLGWGAAASGGTPEQPTTITHTNSIEMVQENITWGTTGGASGNPQSILYKYSPDTIPTYTTIGTITYTYDSNGYVTSWAWS